MIVGRSTANLIFIRSSIFFLRSITPLSFIYIIVVLLLPSRLQPTKYASIYFLIEVLFYLFAFLPRKYYLQLPAVHPPLLFREERKALFLRSIRLVADLDAFLEKWFSGAPISEIKRDNVKQFYRWALLNTQEVREETEEEVEDAIIEFEGLLGRRLESGYGDAKCLRLTLDPVPMLHRPFILYLGIFMIDLCTHLILQFKGYQFHRSSFSRSFHTFPPRPQVFFTTYRSPSAKLTYWFRPQTSTAKRPIVFLHGIGVGLGPYSKLLGQLAKSNASAKEGESDEGTPAIIAIEVLPISTRMTSHVLSAREFCLEMERILAYYGIEDFTLASHSYGSVFTSHLLKHGPISSRIASLILIDPVTLLLLHPEVAYNFTRRPPTMANEHELYYFASQDMCVSHTVARHFFWTQSIVWKEDLLERPPKYVGEEMETRNVTVIVSGLDLIVNSQAVIAYLTCPAFPDWDDSAGCRWYQALMTKPRQTSSWNLDDGSLRVLWFGNLDHSQMLLMKEPVKRVAREILARASIKTGEVVNEGDEESVYD